MNLSIIIINWNSRDYVAACLRTVFRNAPSVHFEVLVLDSGSFDGCGELLARDFPQVRFIQSSDNLGFARANNLAVTHALGNIFLFLNPDTEVQTGAIETLYRVACDRPDAGAVGARLLNTDGTLQTSCVQAFPTILNQVLTSDFLIRLFPNSPLWGKASLFRSGSEPCKVEAVSGAAIMMRREVFEKIGGFCEEYFMYSEDIDLCYQATMSGFSSRYAPTAVIIHHGGGSSQKQPSRFSSVLKTEAVKQYLVRNRNVDYARLYGAAIGLAALSRLFLIGVGALLRAFIGSSSRPLQLPKWFFILRWALGLETWAKKQSQRTVGSKADLTPA